MINLIPNQEKKKKVKDFYFRLVVVTFVMAGLCVVVACVAILPAYFLSSAKKNVVATKLEEQKSKAIPVEGQKTLATVATLSTKLNLIEKAEQNRYVVSEKIINEILLKKTENMKITQITFEVLPAGKKVVVRGIAPTREKLLQFRQALEDNGTFKKVDLPISNFIKGTNIPFSINLMAE